MTKQQLKQIIKEELGGVLKEMDPDLSGLPQSEEEMDQALNPSMPSDVEALEAQIDNLLNSFQGLDPHGRFAQGGMMDAPQKPLISLMHLVDELKKGDTQ